MTDEQKLRAQREALVYGEITYEAGLDVKQVSGHFGVFDAAPSETGPSLFGPPTTTRSNALFVTVIQDRDTLLRDQEQLLIPLTRVIQMRQSPHIH